MLYLSSMESAALAEEQLEEGGEAIEIGEDEVYVAPRASKEDSSIQDDDKLVDETVNVLQRVFSESLAKGLAEILEEHGYGQDDRGAINQMFITTYCAE